MGTRKSKPFSGSYRVGTRKFYSSGKPHWAYDYLVPMNTPLKAVRSGKILDCHSGEAPNSSRVNYPGEPSNWILLGYRNALGQKRTVYYQHLSRVVVKRGQRVRAGNVIGYSGNSGNSTGPHLHIAAMKGWQPAWRRYIYMWSSKLRIYPPSLAWKKSSL